MDAILPPERKTCSKCKTPKPLDEFTKDTYTKDRLRLSCKQCSKKQRLTCCECKKVLGTGEVRKGLDRKRYCIDCMEMMQGKKRCIGCKEIKQLQEFAEDRSRPDGHEFYCRVCRREQQTKKHAKKMLLQRETKQCLRCKEVKDINDFFEMNSTRDKIDLYCKTCRSTNAKQESIGTREPHKFRISIDRQRKLISMYRITIDDYKKLYEQQQGLCAICGRPERNSRRKMLCVDHDHTTGKVRALLCGACNTGLGAFEENRDSLSKAIEYLKQHE